MPAKKSQPPPTYAELNAQLEATLSELQADNIDIDTALKLHQKGMELIDRLEERLKYAENTIHKLKPKT